MFRWGASNERNGVTVGISTRASDNDVKWLMKFLESEFKDVVLSVKYLPITNRNRYKWEEEVKTCSVGILYHSKRQGRINITDIDGGLYDQELAYLSKTLGRQKVMVVLDDMNNAHEDERQRILMTQPSLKILSSQILLFTEYDKLEAASRKKKEFQTVLGGGARATSLKTGLNSFISSVTNNVSTTNQRLPSVPKDILSVKVFSRSAESNYVWLINWLRKADMLVPVDVRGVYISRNHQQFYSELSNCTFAVLYHTLKQGRINVTDVTDSLYDTELKNLSVCLGKDKVIVVIDDLRNSSLSEKERILENQPSIRELANDVFLFSEKDKTSENLEKIKEIINKSAPQKHQQPQPKSIPSHSTTSAQCRQQYKSPENSPMEESTGHRSSGDSLNDYMNTSSTSSRHVRESLSGSDNDSKSASSMSNISCLGRCESFSQKHESFFQNDMDESGEPETKKILLDTSNTAQFTEDIGLMDGWLRELTKNSFEYSETIGKMNNKWKNLQKTIQIKWQQIAFTLNTKEEKIKEQQEMINTLKKKLVKKDGEMKTQENTIQEMKIIAQEKQRTIEKLGKKLQEKENIILDKEYDMQQVRKKIQEQEHTKYTTQGKEHTVKKLEEKLQEKVHTIQEKEHTIQEKEHTIQEKEHTIQEKEHTIQEKEHTIPEKEHIIQEKEQDIQQLRKEFEKMENKLQRGECVTEKKIQEQENTTLGKEHLRKRLPGRTYGQENTMHRQNYNIKGPTIPTASIQEHTIMDEDPPRDRREYSADTTHIQRQEIKQLEPTISLLEEKILKQEEKINNQECEIEQCNKKIMKQAMEIWEYEETTKTLFQKIDTLEEKGSK